DEQSAPPRGQPEQQAQMLRRLAPLGLESGPTGEEQRFRPFEHPVVASRRNRPEDFSPGPLLQRPRRPSPDPTGPEGFSPAGDRRLEVRSLLVHCQAPRPLEQSSQDKGCRTPPKVDTSGARKCATLPGIRRKEVA